MRTCEEGRSQYVVASCSGPSYVGFTSLVRCFEDCPSQHLVARFWLSCVLGASYPPFQISCLYVILLATNPDSLYGRIIQNNLTLTDALNPIEPTFRISWFRFKDRRIRYHIFMYSSPPLAWGNNLGCARLLDDLVHQLPRHQITWRYATRSENLQEEAFAKRVNSRWGSCAGALKPLMKQLDWKIWLCSALTYNYLQLMINHTRTRYRYRTSRSYSTSHWIQVLLISWATHSAGHIKAEIWFLLAMRLFHWNACRGIDEAAEICKFQDDCFLEHTDPWCVCVCFLRECILTCASPSLWEAHETVVQTRASIWDDGGLWARTE